MTGLIIFLIIIAIIVIYLIAIYNGLVTSRNAYKNAFAQIDVQLTRRHDLIPNLVETAKGYLSHERETLEAVTAARTAAVNGLAAAKAQPGDPEAMKQLSGSENQLTQALGRLFAVRTNGNGYGSENDWMGLSFFGMQRDGVRVLGHTGSQAGFRAFMYFDPVKRTAVIVAFNATAARSTPGARQAQQTMTTAAIALLR